MTHTPQLPGLDDSPQENPALTSTTAMLALLDHWVEKGWLRALDHSLTRLLCTQSSAAGQPPSPLLLLAVALTSHQVGRGHVCLDLQQLQAQPQSLLSLPPDDTLMAEPVTRPVDLLQGVTADHWAQALAHPLIMGNPDSNSPLVQQGHRMYLRRYWHYEQTITLGIQHRLSRELPMADPASPPAQALKQVLSQLFPPRPGAQEDHTDWQKVACALAARHAFSIITGGPGTGKTTTVLKLLAALQSVALTSGQQQALRIRLAAPTGKAAARLNESIRGKVLELDLGQLQGGEEARACIPTEVVTLHRLLGSRPDSRQFRYHGDNPLPLDVLVVDEASMVDVEMMASLIKALPPRARLILLGDKDQLASVDAGAVLGDLCQRAEGGHYQPQTCQWLEQVALETLPPHMHSSPPGNPLDQGITMLRQSYRFGAHSGIGQLAAAVRAGDTNAVGADAPLWQGDFTDIQRLSPGRPDDPRLLALFRQELAPYLQHMQEPPEADDPQALNDWAGTILSLHGRFQILCALRKGAWGLEGLNQQIADSLHRAGLIDRAQGWYAGRPVLVTRNDYALNLMNGDIGITLPVPGSNGDQAPGLRVAFMSQDGSGAIRWVLPSRLQSVETVYAMTVHKSQGSEFSHGCLVLPDYSSPVLTRE
ncbi:MAG: exodeoxyribonuclease V subunit alpha, partial [Halomonadaceae bacterium]